MTYLLSTHTQRISNFDFQHHADAKTTSLTIFQLVDYVMTRVKEHKLKTSRKILK